MEAFNDYTYRFLETIEKSWNLPITRCGTLWKIYQKPPCLK